MPKKVYYVKYSKKTGLQEYAVEKYGSMNNFLSKLEKAADKKCKRENIENIMKKADAGVLEKMQLMMKVCEGLRIDFIELFANGNIRELAEPVKNTGAEQSAEEKYSLLSLAAREKTLEYINNILQS